MSIFNWLRSFFNVRQPPEPKSGVARTCTVCGQTFNCPNDGIPLHDHPRDGLMCAGGIDKSLSVSRWTNLANYPMDYE